jgi:hypothetical protein
LVGVFPVKEVDPAIDALKGRCSSYELDGDLHTFGGEDGTTLVVQAHDGYLVASANPSMLRSIDAASVLAGAGLPPGNVTLDLQLSPLAPMLQAALEQGRQVAKTRINQAAEQSAGVDSGGNGEEHGEDADQPESAEIAPATPSFDAAQADAMLDLYFDLLQDGLKNVSRVQISVELSGGHAILHKRLLPNPGSTLAGLLEAQSGGLPDLARLIPAKGNVGSVVANVVPTPAFSDALKAYLGGYLDAMEGLLASAAAEPAAEQFSQALVLMRPLMDRWIECYRGDFAASFALAPETGMSVVEVLGAGDVDACQSVIQETAKLYRQLDVGTGDEPVFVLTENALSHGGVQALRYETRLDTMLAMSGEPETEEATQMLHALFGGDSLVGYTGLAGDRMLVTAGVDAEQAFKDLVDRAARKKKKLDGGLTEAHFAPLQSGAGFFAAIDIGPLIRWVAEEIDEQDEELEKLAALPPEAGRIVYGGRLEKGFLTFEFALPLDMLRAIRELEEHDQPVADERAES